MTDFRAFLGGSAIVVVLPYFGGTKIDAPDRRLRVSGEHEPGWYKTKLDGRNATLVERGQPADLSDRPAIHGHWAEGWLFASGRDVFRIALPPDDEPAPLQRCTGRRWHSGDVLFDTNDFEDDAELAARDALERGQSIAAVKGAVPSLRAAFGYATTLALGREMGVPISPREVAGLALEIAEHGRDRARVLVDILVEERARHIAEMERLEHERLEQLAEQARVQAMNAAQREAHERLRRLGAQARVRSSDPVERVDAALEGARARMLRCRRMSEGLLDVRFQLDGEHYSTIVNANTLQVIDAGICLSGADRQLTLDSLPSVIREAVNTGRLHITRHT